MQYVATIFSLMLFGARTASAHVAYVTSPESLNRLGGVDFHFLLSPLMNVNYLVIMICFLLMIGALYYLGHHIPSFVEELRFIRAQLGTYKSFIPWILRLGLGIMLIGAGAHGVLISQISPTVLSIGAWEIIIGFALLLGFLVTPSLLVVIGFYITGLMHQGYMFGNLEVLGSAIALLLLGSSRPGFDHLFGIPMFFREKFAKYAPVVLRVSLGSAFIFLAFFEKIFNPHFFASVVDSYNLTSIIRVSPAMWTLSTGAIELIVGLCILFGFKTRITTLIAFCVFTTTFFFFRESVYSHVSIFAALSALFIMGSGKWSIDDYIATKSLQKKPTRRIATSTKKRAPRKATASRKRTNKVAKKTA